MHDAIVIWDMDDDPTGNVVHIAEHDLTKDDVLHALNDPESGPTSAGPAATRSRSARRPTVVRSPSSGNWSRKTP